MGQNMELRGRRKVGDGRKKDQILGILSILEKRNKIQAELVLLNVAKPKAIKTAVFAPRCTKLFNIYIFKIDNNI